jgi:hypothetical protein
LEYAGDSVVMPINPWMWSGMMTHASNRTYGRTDGVRRHSCAAMHPAADNPTIPFRTCPKNGHRSSVHSFEHFLTPFRAQIVTKYHADRR